MQQSYSRNQRPAYKSAGSRPQRPNSRPKQAYRTTPNGKGRIKKERIFIKPNWPTRAAIRNERNRRIEYHFINIVRESMKDKSMFERIMAKAKALADQEIAREKKNQQPTRKN